MNRLAGNILKVRLILTIHGNVHRKAKTQQYLEISKNYVWKPTIMNRHKQELSYFRLKLESLYEWTSLPKEWVIRSLSRQEPTWHWPPAAMPWHKAFNHLEAESIASEVLFCGLHFSKYDTLCFCLRGRVWEGTACTAPEKLVPILLSNKAIRHIRQIRFDGHIGFWRAIRPSLHRTHRHDSAAHREQSTCQWSNRRREASPKAL